MRARSRARWECMKQKSCCDKQTTQKQKEAQHSFSIPFSPATPASHGRLFGRRTDTFHPDAVFAFILFLSSFFSFLHSLVNSHPFFFFQYRKTPPRTHIHKPYVPPRTRTLKESSHQRAATRTSASFSKSKEEPAKESAKTARDDDNVNSTTLNTATSPSPLTERKRTGSAAREEKGERDSRLPSSRGASAGRSERREALSDTARNSSSRLRTCQAALCHRRLNAARSRGVRR